MVEPAIEFATHFLETGNLSPARRLELSRQFSIHKWVPSAFENLLQTTSSLTDEDAEQIGFKTYHILMKAREMIDTRRKSSGTTIFASRNKKTHFSHLAHVVPPMPGSHDYLCKDHKQCGRAWKDTWKNKISKRLIHPTDPLPLHGVADFVIALEIPELSPTCKDDLVESILNHQGFLVEKSIIAAAVEAVIAFNRSL
jgi:hypothetical protein